MVLARALCALLGEEQRELVTAQVGPSPRGPLGGVLSFPASQSPGLALLLFSTLQKQLLILTVLVLKQDFGEKSSPAFVRKTDFSDL